MRRSADRRCHRAYDGGELDLLPHLEPGHRAEVAHAVLHIGLLRLLQRLTATRWWPGETTPKGKERE